MTDTELLLALIEKIKELGVSNGMQVHVRRKLLMFVADKRPGLCSIDEAVR